MSLKSLLIFLTSNFALISISLIIKYLLSYYNLFLLITAKNFLLINLLELITSKNEEINPQTNNSEMYNTRNIKLISDNIRIDPQPEYFGEFELNVIQGSFVEYLSYLTISYFFGFQQTSLWIDLLLFIPKSFIFEIMFDFLHYVTHRLVHAIPIIYKNTHKKHHKFSTPICITAYYQDIFDLLFTNYMPFIITSYFIPLSYYEFILYNIYKSFIEISGHCGKETSSSSFPQMYWLPKLFHIELTVNDHDLHHTRNNCNYAKRFKLWDKIFGTYAY